jgi:hypothetical protein
MQKMNLNPCPSLAQCPNLLALETMRFTPPDVVREDQAPNIAQTIHPINELEGAVVDVANQSGDKTEGLPDISAFSEGLGIGGLLKSNRLWRKKNPTL